MSDADAFGRQTARAHAAGVPADFFTVRDDTRRPDAPSEPPRSLGTPVAQGTRWGSELTPVNVAKR
eukprot:2762739-Prymnesium_polylepis.1